MEKILTHKVNKDSRLYRENGKLVFSDTPRSWTKATEESPNLAFIMWDKVNEFDLTVGTRAFCKSLLKEKDIIITVHDMNGQIRYKDENGTFRHEIKFFTNYRVVYDTLKSPVIEPSYEAIIKDYCNVENFKLLSISELQDKTTDEILLLLPEKTHYRDQFGLCIMTAGEGDFTINYYSHFVQKQDPRIPTITVKISELKAGLITLYQFFVTEYPNYLKNKIK